MEIEDTLEKNGDILFIYCDIGSQNTELSIVVDERTEVHCAVSLFGRVTLTLKTAKC